MKRFSTIIVILALLCVLPKAMAAIITPFEKPKFEKARSIRTGKASWYSQKSPGINHRTANNEIFNDKDMTCAIWGVGFNKRIRVTNIANGKTITVRVNDRGPHKRYVRKGRVIDLTRAAFKKISAPDQGLIKVKLEFL